jgi:hypothetical protein
VNDHRHLIVDLNARFITKRFPNDGEGERIVVWDKSRTKALFIQVYFNQFGDPDDVSSYQFIAGLQ